MMTKKIILTGLLLVCVLSAITGYGTIADFIDTEISTGNTFELCAWSDTSINVDVKPGSCPNPINTGSEGVLPIAILGTEDRSVGNLDPASVRVWRANDTGDSIGGNVEPLMHSYEDTATPFDHETEEGCCHELAGDGIDDLNLKFDRQALVDDLRLDEIADNTEIYLILTVDVMDDGGNITDTLVGQDCVRVQH